MLITQVLPKGLVRQLSSSWTIRLRLKITTTTKKQNLARDAIDATVNDRECWCGIIDGDHSNYAVLWHIENKTEWKK